MTSQPSNKRLYRRSAGLSALGVLALIASWTPLTLVQAAAAQPTSSYPARYMAASRTLALTAYRREVLHGWSTGIFPLAQVA